MSKRNVEKSFMREKFQIKLIIINVFTIRENTAAKIVAVNCGGSQICQHNKRKYYCKLCWHSMFGSTKIRN